MLQVKLKQLNDPAFINAIIRLNNERGMDQTTSYRIGKFAQQADRLLKKAADEDDTILKPYLDAGKCKENEHKEMEWSDKDAQKEYQAKKDELLDRVVEFKIHKIDFKALKNLTGLELSAIEEILDNVPEA